MLRLSELSGFIVCGSLTEKSMAKSRQKTAKETPSQSNYGEGLFSEWLRVRKIYSRNIMRV